MRRIYLLAGVAVALLAATVVWGALMRPGAPPDTSPEAGFARDMQVHHSQAVRMSMIVRDRTRDEETRRLAYDIALTQQQQIGQMYAWLETWGLPQTSSGRPMAWMKGRHHVEMTAKPEQPTPESPPMPGMATSRQLKELEQASGRDAEVRFLRLMIAHHQAGVQMAEAALSLSDDPQVRRMATSMVAAQQSEIDLMERMLVARGEAERTQ
ncbi:DUF305 domain-containing protein [Microtetraspora fusca]|uniref:DUF305 domain-containing protein n=1 Tax=Microtetraspora fusca TaxID=1997 RepID=UPI0008330D7A|nr:DUF305 domain-containing protein [Microtetraspora fusca]